MMGPLWQLSVGSHSQRFTSSTHSNFLCSVFHFLFQLVNFVLISGLLGNKEQRKEEIAAQVGSFVIFVSIQCEMYIYGSDIAITTAATNSKNNNNNNRTTTLKKYNHNNSNKTTGNTKCLFFLSRPRSRNYCLPM